MACTMYSENDSLCLSTASEANRLPNDPGIEHSECQISSQSALETITRNRNSAARVIVAGLKFPLDFTLHVAKGFHNAPKLYGDGTVRPLQKIDGLKGGLECSGKVGHSIAAIRWAVLTA